MYCTFLVSRRLVRELLFCCWSIAYYYTVLVELYFIYYYYYLPSSALSTHVTLVSGVGYYGTARFTTTRNNGRRFC